jgi:hypothetical protein
MFRSTIFVTTVAAAALCVGIATASAQTPPDSAPPRAPWARGSGPMMGPGMMLGPGMWGPRGYGRMCDPQVAGLGPWRADQIERAVQPNETQKAALAKLREASTKAAEIIAAGCPTELPRTSTARLELMEKRMTAMLQAITTLRPIFDAFYATLNDEQKARLDSVGPGRWGGMRWHWRWRDR